MSTGSQDLNLCVWLCMCVVVYVRQKADAQVVELQAGREKAQQKLAKVQKEASEVRGKVKELSSLLDTEKAG